MVVESLKWVGGVDGYLELIDQRRLPGELVRIRCETVEQLYEAVKTLAVRGAPAIGVAGGFGLCLALKQLGSSSSGTDSICRLREAAELLGLCRPTGANLQAVLRRIIAKAVGFIGGNPGAGVGELRQLVLAEAQAVLQQDIRMCRSIGINGERFIEAGAAILTHCNAGALATAGEGTALSILFEAKRRGKSFTVYVDETRPLLQGTRLTAWELRQAGIDVTVLCDGAAGWLIKQGKVSAVITGADRIAANGDAANKIGTYSLSVLAACHGVPFYVAAPTSTFDLEIGTGAEIPIEHRSPDEVLTVAGLRIAPQGVRAYNPAFDVTEAANITAIITEKGVIERPDARKIAVLLAAGSDW
jgi:methylthioribose-1-phosphate isomerase